MDTYAGRLLADRYRLPKTPSEEFELVETRAFDTASGQEVLVRQVPLPEIIDAETLDEDGRRARPAAGRLSGDRATRMPEDPVVRRAVEAAAAAARLPDHPRLDQVFDVFVQGDGLWIVSELVPARPLAAVLAEERLGPYRAAEVAADLLAALRIAHAHGWTHRNVTARTVMICEDGRAVLTGLAAGAAEEVLCGYDPLPSGVPDTFAAAPARHLPPPPSPTGPGPQHEDTAARVRERGGLPPGYEARQQPEVYQPQPSQPQPYQPQPYQPEARQPYPEPYPEPYQHGPVPRGGPLPDAYKRWETGAVQRIDEQGRQEPPGGGGPDLVARVRQQGGSPQDPQDPPDPQAPGGPQPDPGVEGLPVTWDFEGGAGASDRGGRAAIAAARAAEESRPPLTMAERAAAERAARSGAIAAYRAGTQAGAAHRSGGTSPTELPGAGRPTHPVRTGWEPSVGQAIPAQPRREEPQRPARAVPAARAGQPRAAAAQVPDNRYRGPDSARAAERARQARIMTVGAVTERWAPEQAGPVYEHWRLAPPVGPPADFWALGALLFRMVQGYPPYPEENAAELTQAVCAEQPAFAEDSGALRPIIESLLRQDPTERPSAEELRGWLRSLLRGAPEPDVGRFTITAPPALEPGRPSDPRRLPIVRRRGELVGPRRRPRARGPRVPQGPSRMGRALLTLVMIGLAGAVAYVLAFMSSDDEAPVGAREPGAQEPEGSATPLENEDPTSDPTSDPSTDPPPEDDPTEDGGQSSPAEGDQEPVTPPDGFTLVEDREGFSVAVPEGWDRSGINGDGQVIYAKDGLELLIVPGRDDTGEFPMEPSDYQFQEEPELDAFRAYQFSSFTGLDERREGDISLAEAIFSWKEDGAEQVAYNRVMLIDGAFHVVMVRGPDAEQDRMGTIYEIAAASYATPG